MHDQLHYLNHNTNVMHHASSPYHTTVHSSTYMYVYIPIYCSFHCKSVSVDYLLPNTEYPWQQILRHVEIVLPVCGTDDGTFGWYFMTKIAIPKMGKMPETIHILLPLLVPTPIVVKSMFQVSRIKLISR